MLETITFNQTKWKARVKSKGRGSMKVYFDLDKEESEGFKSFMSMVKPAEISIEDFCKVIFFRGVESLNHEFASAAKKYVEEHRTELAEEGYNVDEFSQTLNQQSLDGPSEDTPNV